MPDVPNLGPGERSDIGDEALWRKHVTRGQMTRLEAGQTILLNPDQLSELRHYAPKWVTVVAYADGSFYHVSITDMRKKQ